MENFLYQVQTFFKRSVALAKEHLWADLKNPQLPEHVSTELSAYPVEVQRHFEYNFRRKLTRIQRSRTFLLIVGVITLINGVVVVPIGVGFYLWHLKNTKLPKLAEKNFERSVRQYNYHLKRSGQSGGFQQVPPTYNHQPSVPKRPVPSSGMRMKPRTISTDFDPTDLTIDNLQDGYIFDYDLKTWEVEHQYQFDWADGSSERAFKCQSHVDTIFLYLKKEGGQLLVNVSEPINIHALHQGLEQEILSNGIPRNIIEYKDKVFYRENEWKGNWFDISGKAGGLEVKAWEYYDTHRSEVLKIENYGKGQIKATLGKWVSSFHFSEILPGNKNLS